MRYIESHVHRSQVGVLVELETDSDQTTQNQEFRQLAHDLALQIVAGKPLSVRGLASVEDAKTPSGYADKALLSQGFIKDPTITVAQHVANISARLNAPIRITRFVRLDINDP